MMNLIAVPEGIHSYIHHFFLSTNKNAPTTSYKHGTHCSANYSKLYHQKTIMVDKP